MNKQKVAMSIAMRRKVWDYRMGNKCGEEYFPVCLKNKIQQLAFDIGHIVVTDIALMFRGAIFFGAVKRPFDYLPG